MNIYEKMAEVMKAVKYLSKDGKIEFNNTKYKAISEQKVTSVVREQLIEQGLVIFPVKQEHTKTGTLTTVNVTYRIVNIEEPSEFIEVVSSGTGFDTQDKGVGKAMTYAYKYMLLRTFAIPTGEDPDQVCNEQIESEQLKASQAEQANPEAPATAAQKATITKVCKAHKLNLDAWLAQNGLNNPDQLTVAQATQMIRTLKNEYGDEVIYNE